MHRDYADYMCEHYVLLCEYYEFSLIYVFCVIIVYCFYCTPGFGGSPTGEAAKTGVALKKQYIPRLTKEHMALYFSVYGHMVGAWGRGRVSPNYIPWLCITEKYIPIYSSITRNQ
jgi:hypothetical protein